MVSKKRMLRALRLCVRAMADGRPGDVRQGSLDRWDRAFEAADSIVNPQDYDGETFSDPMEAFDVIR